MNVAVVVGAGVFGSSTARELARRGWKVTLVEQYSPGTVRSASGGDTRLLRMAHGDAEWYCRLARRARDLWLELQETTGVRIWEPVGVAWFARRPDGFEARSRETLARLGIPHEWLAPDSATGLYPSLGTEDLHGVLFEPEAGALQARRATQLLVEDAPVLEARQRIVMCELFDQMALEDALARRLLDVARRDRTCRGDHREETERA